MRTSTFRCSEFCVWPRLRLHARSAELSQPFNEGSRLLGFRQGKDGRVGMSSVRPLQACTLRSCTAVLMRVASITMCVILNPMGTAKTLQRLSWRCAVTLAGTTWRILKGLSRCEQGNVSDAEPTSNMSMGPTSNMSPPR